MPVRVRVRKTGTERCIQRKNILEPCHTLCTRDNDPCMRPTGLTKEADCAWCAPGKYQTGVGLIAEANCTSCVAGKYQSGSGLNAASFLLHWYLLTHTLVVYMHMTGDIGVAPQYTLAEERARSMIS